MDMRMRPMMISMTLHVKTRLFRKGCKAFVTGFEETSRFGHVRRLRPDWKSGVRNRLQKLTENKKDFRDDESKNH